MAQAARRIETQRSAPRVARLRLVETPPAPRVPGRPSARSRARGAEARARSIFTVFTVAFLCLVALGGVRLVLTTQAAEYALSENMRLDEIKQQRVAVDQLEIDRSALSTPSRIADIAASTMAMGEPRSVNYIAASDVEPSNASVSDAETSSEPGVLARVVEAVVDLSAGEAQSLLVGDLGLAGSR